MAFVKVWHGVALAAALLFQVCGGGQALAGTYFISTAGRDDGDGSEANPWNRFEASVPALKAGDTVVVEPGVYHGPIQLVGRGADDAEVHPDGGEAGIVFRSREPWAAIIEGSPDQNPKIPILHLGRARNVTIEGFFFRRTTPIKGSLAVGMGKSGITIRGCKFEGVYTGVGFLRCSNCLMEGNLFVRTAVGLYLGRRGGTEYVVRNNTFIGSNGVLAGYTHGRNYSHAVIENNIFVDCDNGSIHKMGVFSKMELANNCFWDVKPENRGQFKFLRNASWKGEIKEPRSLDLAYRGTELIADPLFADVENDDFRLLPDSPCLGSGTDGTDIGAFGLRNETGN